TRRGDVFYRVQPISASDRRAPIIEFTIRQGWTAGWEPDRSPGTTKRGQAALVVFAGTKCYQSAPGGSEINHGIHRNPRKRESESTPPFCVRRCFSWLPVCDDLSCRSNTASIPTPS